MKYYKQVKLKNGKACIIRNQNCEDSKEVLQHIILTSVETEYMLSYFDEILMTDEEERTHLSNIEASPDELLISAVIDGKIVANAGLSPVSKLDKCRHRAEFGISIEKKYWGWGIGSCMMSAILEIAGKAGYEQVELEVVTDNQRAISLYKKYGFKIFGTNEMAFRCRDGQYQSLYLMSRRL
ncbi:GNAT family N-acetyltransferase [Clostridium boliviensis]|uniref:GNAT family N-acetyltransferase n=1 Tax=Clostridium boliviensis TaxID=318465 RepID=A0ABU4GH05_9CLOT|nr:GNAT family N-acetyltransferase [Clostridium boliviensis]MDW2796900.1 GNAT family N-acetyltransferase [Clostridium boliviensis]